MINKLELLSWSPWRFLMSIPRGWHEVRGHTHNAERTEMVVRPPGDVIMLIMRIGVVCGAPIIPIKLRRERQRQAQYHSWQLLASSRRKSHKLYTIWLLNYSVHMSHNRNFNFKLCFCQFPPSLLMSFRLQPGLAVYKTALLTRIYGNV